MDRVAGERVQSRIIVVRGELHESRFINRRCCGLQISK
jgi:hypothetical protein